MSERKFLTKIFPKRKLHLNSNRHMENFKVHRLMKRWTRLLNISERCCRRCCCCYLPFHHCAAMTYFKSFLLTAETNWVNTDGDWFQVYKLLQRTSFISISNNIYISAISLQHLFGLNHNPCSHNIYISTLAILYNI